MRILELGLLVFRPLGEQRGSTVLPAEVSPECLVKATTEEQRCPTILLFPPVEVSITIASWAAQVLSDLGIAIGHWLASRLAAGANSSQSAAGAKPSKFRKE